MINIQVEIMIKSYINKISDSVSFLQNRIDSNGIKTALLFGRGMPDLFIDLEEVEHIPFSDIPSYPVREKEKENCAFSIYKYKNSKLVAMNLLYAYDGYSQQNIVYSVRVLKELGIEKIYIFDNCVSVTPSSAAGQIVVVSDQINLFGDNPLIGKNLDKFGPRFPDMSFPFDKEMRNIIQQICVKDNISWRNDVVAGKKGPNGNTDDEMNFYKKIGAGALVVSIVPETIAAAHCNLACCAVCQEIDADCLQNHSCIKLNEILKNLFNK